MAQLQTAYHLVDTPLAEVVRLVNTWRGDYRVTNKCVRLHRRTDDSTQDLLARPGVLSTDKGVPGRQQEAIVVSTDFAQGGDGFAVSFVPAHLDTGRGDIGGVADRIASGLPAVPISASAD